MRILVLCCLVLLAGCVYRPEQYAAFTGCVGREPPPLQPLYVAPCAGLEDVTRVETLTPVAYRGFIYSAHTNTVMSENDDGAAERIRRQWLVEALRTRGLCPNGYLVDKRQLVQQPVGPFANGGDIVYAGRCL